VIEIRLRVASGHVREQLRHHDIAQSDQLPVSDQKKRLMPIIICAKPNIAMRVSHCSTYCLISLKQRHADIALELMDLVEQQSVRRSVSKLPGAEQDAARRLYEEAALLNSGRRRQKFRVKAPPTRVDDQRH
jgi:hypothetical protein